MARCTNRSRGFTLIDMLIVISLVMILVAIAVPNYQRSIMRAKESVLKQDLFQLRDLISQYTLDKQKAPQSLDDLIQAGYLKQLPRDPMTNEADWQVEQMDDQTMLSPDEQDQGGIDYVHSNSSQVGSDGRPYKNW